MPRHTRVRTRLVCPIVALSTCIFTITALPGLTTLYRSSHVQLQGLGTLLHIPVSSRPPPDDVRVEIQIVPSNVCFFAIPPPPDVGVEIRIVHPIDVKRLLFLRWLADQSGVVLVGGHACVGLASYCRVVARSPHTLAAIQLVEARA